MILAANTGDAGTAYGHIDPGNNETWHYQISAINTIGQGNASDAAEATTLAALTVTPEERGMVDTDGDGRISGVDASALYFQATDVEEVEPEVRRTLLGPLLPPGVDRTDTDAVDNAIDEVLADIEAILEANEDALDVNGDGVTNELDAQIILNVTTFPELVGDGTEGSGFLTYRKDLIGRFMSGGNPSDAEMRAVIRAIRGL